MTDRPEKLYKCEITPTYDKAYDPPEYFGNVISYPEATPADLLAAVRAAVESGEIEGMEEQCPWCAGDGYWEDTNPLPGYSPGPAPMECPYCRGIGTVLVLPVSDGGSET